MNAANSAPRTMKAKILLLIGFCFALLGYLNAIPDFGPLPSIGVIRAADLHPSMFAVGLVISFLVVSEFSRNPSSMAVTAFNAALVIVALYALWSRLESFEGAGVYYSATDIEARFCGGQETIIVGGGNSAGQAAMFLARRTKHVHILIRKDNLHETMSAYLSSRIQQDPNITVHPFTEVCELHGDETLAGVSVKNGKSGVVTEMNVRGLFIMIGSAPNTGWLDGVVELSDKGFVPTGDAVGAKSDYETSTPGIYAVGDVRLGSVKRVASSVDEGSVVISHVWQHVNGGETP